MRFPVLSHGIERRLLELTLLLALFYWFAYSEHRAVWFTESLRDDIYHRSVGHLGRPFFYSVLLQGLQWLTGTYQSIIYLQFFFFFLSLAYLLIQFYRYTQSTWVALGFLSLIAFNYELMQYPFMVLTESFIISLLMIMTGALFGWMRTKDKSYLWLLSTALALAIVTKSSAYAWLSMPFLLIIGIYHDKEKHGNTIGPLTVPILLTWFISSSVSYIQNGTFSNESTLGEMLIGKAGMVVKKDMVSDYPAVIREMNNIAKPIQDYIQKAETLRDRYFFSFLYADVIRLAGDTSRSYFKPIETLTWRYYKHYLDYIENRTQISIPNEFMIENWVEFNKRRLKVSKEIIQQAPLAYLKEAGLNYLALWLGWDVLNKTEYQHFSHLIEKWGPIPYYFNISIWNGYQDESRIRIAPKPDWYVTFYRVIIQLSALMSLLAPLVVLVSWFRKKPISDTLGIICILGLTAQAFFILTAVVNNSAFRYAITLWPIMALLVTLGIFGIWDWLARKS